VTQGSIAAVLEEAVGTARRHHFTAKTVTDALHRYGVEEVVTSGGGTRIPILMRILRSNATTERPRMIEGWGIPSEFTKAYAFAVLSLLRTFGVDKPETGGLKPATGLDACAQIHHH